jgi:fructokinase
MKTLAFGEVLWDVYENSKHIGGAPLNFAAHFKKCGGESWILTAVGNDELGKETVLEIEKLGVNTDYIFTVEKQTGRCLVTLDENSVPKYNLLNDVAYDCIQSPCIPNGFFDVLYFGSLALRGENNSTVLKKLIKENHFKNIFVDVNIRPPFFSAETIKFAFENATIMKISNEELPIIMDTLNEPMICAKECAKSFVKSF